MRIFWIFCFSFLFFSKAIFAQNVVFSLEASANTMGMEDQIQVAFTIENVQNLSSLQNPSFPGFQVVAGPIRQSRTSIINGEYSQAESFTFVLQATKTGTFTIPAIVAKDASGKAYQCNSLSITVVNGSLARQQQLQRQQQQQNAMAAIQQQHAQMMQQMQQHFQQMMQGQNGGAVAPQNLPNVSEKDLGKTVLMRVIVDKTKVNVGEQITATYKMYYRISFMPEFKKLPLPKGFWIQELEVPDEQKPKIETINGIQYESKIFKKIAIFPQQTGTLTIEPAEAICRATIANYANPNGKNVEFTITNPPVNISVSALPSIGQPENFGAAVGNFTLNSHIGKTQLTTDETTNLTLTITGTGNIQLIQAPKINLPNGLDIFDPTIVDSITGRSTTISGFKTISYAIAPRLPGNYEIPAIPFSFYNSSTKSYTTLFSKAVKIHVIAGKNYKKEVAENKSLTDIHDIKKQALSSSFKNTPIIFSVSYWSLYLLPLLALLFFVFWKRKKEDEANNVGLFKNKYANKIALKRLKTAKAFLETKQTIPFYEEISKAIWLYLSDKLHIPLSTLSKESANEALRKKQIPESTLQQMNSIIDESAMALYAPAGAVVQMNHTYEETIKLIAALEEILKK